MEWGWRLSIGLAMVPAAFFFIGALCCPDTPTSMLYRNPNNEEKARQVSPLYQAISKTMKNPCHKAHHIQALPYSIDCHRLTSPSGALHDVLLCHQKGNVFCHIYRGHTEWLTLVLDCCLQVLRAMRGVEDVSIELQEIIQNAQEARNDSLLGSAKALYSKAHYKQAMAACLIPFFQQFTGMNAIMFYGKSRLVALERYAFSCIVFL